MYLDCKYFTPLIKMSLDTKTLEKIDKIIWDGLLMDFSTQVNYVALNLPCLLSLTEERH